MHTTEFIYFVVLQNSNSQTIIYSFICPVGTYTAGSVTQFCFYFFFSTETRPCESQAAVGFMGDLFLLNGGGVVKKLEQLTIKH